MPAPKARPAGNIDCAFISLHPLEVVLVASNAIYAEWLEKRTTHGRRSTSHPLWVYMPLPRDLTLVRPGSKGDSVLEFSNAQSAKYFYEMIAGLGLRTADHPTDVRIGRQHT
ncbi:hypothetical protein EV127DRAFT_517820 [Xylaria flabelliformis]|nr:hypothetical protein EV127DRAFT_517820 [Xylaria flabelliformis]